MGGEPRHRYARGLLQGERGRLAGGGLRGHRPVLGVAPTGEVESVDLVAHREVGNPGPDLLDHPRGLETGDVGELHLSEQAPAGHHIPVPHARRPYADEHLPGTGLGLG